MKGKPRSKQKSPAGRSLTTFGEMIRQRREDLHISMAELAADCGLDQGNLSRIETGKRKPPELPFVLKMAERLQVPRDSQQFHDLLRRAEEEKYADRVQFPALASWLEDEALTGIAANVINCGTSGAMVSKAMEKALRSDAKEIAVKLPDGKTITYRLRKPRAKSKGAGARLRT